MPLKLFAALLLFLTSCYSSSNPLRKEMKHLRSLHENSDTSYVYALPYENGKTFRVIQGYFSQFSHKERAAIDFNMKPGTKIAAAREGIVVRMKEDGDKGGFNKKLRSYGNYIVIQHADGSRAGYWHLSKDGSFVNVGDSVKKGEVIGLSGQTGYAAVPHLHFLVWRSDPGKRFVQVPTRFQTTSGIKYLKFWGSYRK
jgi:murein DD-endopeptidase MepM/ murein hydrolase activator NlpD